MVAAQKFALRIALVSAMLAGVSAPALAAAADEEFMFQAAPQVLDLDGPRRDRFGMSAWDEEDLDSAPTLFSKWFAPKTVAVASQDAVVADSDFQPRLERIRLDASRPDRTGHAASYGQDFDGRLTATGERFDMYRLTAASADLPLNSYVKVSNLQTGESVTVRINDRRPAADGELITLSLAASNRLGLDEAPGAQVKLTYLGQIAPPASAPIKIASR